MAWPRSVRSAFAKQMIAEAVIERLAAAALGAWMPHVRNAVLPSALTAAGEPNPENILATRGIWYSIMDSLFLHGLGHLYSYEMVQALAALGIVLPEPSPEAVPERIPEQLHPDIDQVLLNQQALEIVAAALGISIGTLAAAAATPSVRQYQAAYLASVRNRMADVPESTFRALTRQLDEALELGEGVDKMRVRVADTLGIDELNRRAVTIARTESAGAMTSSVIDAAKSTGEVQLEKTWVATMDKRTRKSHYEADGQRVGVDGKFRVGRSELRHPGDPRAPAKEVVNCRCAVFVLRKDENDPGEAGRQSISKAERDAEITRREQDGQVRDRDQNGARVASAHKEENAMPMFRTWTAVLAEIGKETDDGRMLHNDIELSFREFPLPLMWQKQSEPGHYSSYAVGVIETAERKGDQLVGTGYLLNTAEADEAAQQIEHGVSRPSVDLGSAEWMLTDQDGNEIDIEDWWDDNLPEDTRVVETMLAAKLLGATLVSMPAFGGVSITLAGEREIGVEDEAALVASLVASGERTFEDEFKPRRELFGNPRLRALTPVTYDAKTGRVFGHLAPWEKAHIAVGEQAPKSPSGYRYFHTSHINTDTGPIMVGKLTVDTGHAGLRLASGPAAEHYDNTGSTWAYVCAGEDQFGIWISGVLHPSASNEKVHDGLASPLSGDWREINGAYELVAALSVNVPGFPLVAGATRNDGSRLSLVAALGPRPVGIKLADAARRGLTAAVGDEGDDEEDTDSDVKFPVGTAVTVGGQNGTVNAAEATTGYEVKFEDDSTAWYVERDVTAAETDTEAQPDAQASVNVDTLAAAVVAQLRAADKRKAEAAAIVGQMNRRAAAAVIKNMSRK